MLLKDLKWEPYDTDGLWEQADCGWFMLYRTTTGLPFHTGNGPYSLISKNHEVWHTKLDPIEAQSLIIHYTTTQGGNDG